MNKIDVIYDFTPENMFGLTKEECLSVIATKFMENDILKVTIKALDH
jgi:hypothetical protein